MSRILVGEPARAALFSGIRRMTDLVRPTLGPLPRTVAIAPIIGQQPPEILDSAATIARRTIQLADAGEDMGAMMVRNLTIRVFERVGDGTATAAVLTDALARNGRRYVASGANVVALNRGIWRGLGVVSDELRRRARTIDTPSEIANMVAGSLRSAQLAEMVGEAVDAVGADGAVLVEEAQATTCTLAYSDGLRWNAGYASPFFGSPMPRMLEPCILVTDCAIDAGMQLVRTLEVCVANDARSLLVVAPEIRDAAIGMLLTNRERGTLKSVAAVRAPCSGDQQTRVLEDIAVITGGRCISRARGDRLEDVALGDFGRARQAWATRSAFGIVGGRGDKSAIRQRLTEARAELNTVEEDSVRQVVQERIGKLAGTSAILHVGAASVSEREELRLRLEAALSTARLALRDGVVPGGGSALQACGALLETDARDDESLGISALAEALAAPMRAILANSGIEPEPVLCDSRARACVYDVVRREWVDPWTSGIVDPLAVLLAALECSVSTATSALTAEVLIHH